MRIGEKKTFVPEGFLLEAPAKDPNGTKEYPRRVTGTVTWVHPKGRFYLVTFTVNGYELRQCFQDEARRPS